MKNNEFVKVIDDFLPEEELKELQDVMMGPNFPWFYNNSVAFRKVLNDPFEYYFTHSFFEDVLQSRHNHIIERIILSKFKWFSLKRIKGNLYPATNKKVTYEFHTDYKFKHKGLILSLNTCNGGTILSDGKVIKSVANRALFFDPSKKHTCTNCTDTKGRFNININYV